MPQDLDLLLASFLPGSPAAAVFVAANQRISSSSRADLRDFSANIIRYLENREPISPGSAGEYRLFNLDKRPMLLVSSLINDSQPVSLLFPIEARFEEILNAFSALEKLLNAPELADLSGLKPRKSSSASAQRWQDTLFETQPESPAEADLPAQAGSQPDVQPAPSSEGWTLIF